MKDDQLPATHTRFAHFCSRIHQYRR